MNKVYRTVWNEHTNTWVAVQETAKARGKSSQSGGSIVSELGLGGSRFMMTAAASAVLLMSGQVMAAGGNKYPTGQGSDNYCYYDTTSQSVVCGDATTSVADTYDGKTAKSTAIGFGAKTTGESNVALGAGSSAAKTAATALGASAKALNDYGVAIGYESVANNTWDISIGRRAGANAVTSGDGRNIAIGDGALREAKNANNNTVLGTSAGAGLTGGFNIAMGAYANSPTANGSPITADNTIALGQRAVASTSNSIALGNRSKATGTISNAIGASAEASGNYSVANGYAATASGNNAIAIGAAQNLPNKTEATGAAAIAIGTEAKATNRDATAIGKAANAAGQDGIAVGLNANAAGQGVVAMGTRAGVAPTGPGVTYVAPTDAVFIGSSAGHGSNNNRMQIAIGNNAGKDVGSKGGAATENVAIGNAAGSGVNGNTNVAISSRAGRNVEGHDNFAALLEAGENVKGINNIAIGKQAGRGTSATTPLEVSNTIAMGFTAQGTHNDTIALGRGAKAQIEDSIAIGRGVTTEILPADNTLPNNGVGNREGMIAIGSEKTKASGKAAVAIGRNAEGIGRGTVALGDASKSLAGQGVAVGAQANVAAAAAGGVAIGSVAKSQGLLAVALGSQSEASAARSVAVGTLSQANRAALTPNATTADAATAAANQVYALDSAAAGDKTAISATVKGDFGAVSVGKADATRQIINVAAGSEDSDAVNVAQLKAVANQVASGKTHYYSVNDNNNPQNNYNNDGATGENALAAGVKAAAVGKNAISVGESASANSTTGALAIGSTYVGHNLRDDALQIADSDVTLDPGFTDRGALASGQRVRKVGNEWKPEVTESVKAWSNNAIAIGVGAEAGLDKANPQAQDAGKTGAIAIGTRALAYEVASVALGEQAGAFGKASVALGTESTANNINGVAVGSGATAEADNTVAAGFKAVADGKSAVAVGDQAWTSQAASQSLALGNLAEVQGRGQTLKEIQDQDLTKIGNGAVKGVAVGYKAVAVAGIEGGVALGAHSTADRSALGVAGQGVLTSINPTATEHTVEIVGRDKSQTTTVTRKTVDTVYALDIASGTDKQAITETTLHTLGAVSVGGYNQDGKPQTRQITNVAAGSLDSDAVNVAQLKAVANQIKNAGAGGTHYYSVNDNGTSGDNYNNDGALGQNSMAAGIAASTTNVALSSVAMGHGATVDTEKGIAIGHNASAGGQQTANIAIGDTASAGASGAVVLGTQAKSDNTGYNSIVIGAGAKAEGTVSNRVTDVIVLGTGATANAASNIAIGFGAKSDSKSDAVSIGRLANAKGNISIAFGQGAKTSDNAGKSVAVGDQAETQASFGVALGSEAQVKTGAFYGVALGQGAKAQHRDAVALGSGAETAAAVSTNNATVGGITYGGFAGNTAHSTISVGSDSRKRTITNVAAGRINATSTDAINGSQLFATQTVIGNVASTTATHLGGGATVGADGKISEPSYNVTDAAGNTVGTAANNVGAALANLNTYVNSGFDVQGNGTTQGTVSPTEKINFINGTGTTAVVSQETNGVTNITFNVNAQNLAESAQLPVVYTDGFGNKVYKHTDGNFYDQPNGAGTQIAPGDIVATMQAADGSVTTPTALTNVAAGANDTDAVNVSQLKGAAAALGGGATVNPDGSFKAPEYTLTNGDPSTGNTATYNTVGDALAGLNTAVNQPLTFGGDTGTAFSRRLGSTVNVKGGATGNLTDGNIGVEASNGTLNVKLAENIDLGASGSVKMGNTTVNNAGVTIANAADPSKNVSLTGSGLNNGGNKITNVAAGTADTDAVNFGQLKDLRDTVNIGWNIGNDATAPVVGAVTPGKRVDFVAGNSSTKVEVTQNANTGNSEVKISAAPAALQYTDTNTAAGGNTPVDPFTPTNQVTLVGAGGNTSNGVTINNVAPAELSTTSKQAVNGSQLHAVGNSTAKALGGTSSFNPTTGQVTAGLSVGGNNYTTVQSALNAINTTAGQANNPLTFAGDTGTNVERKLGSTVNVKGGVTDPAKLTDNNIGVVANGSDTLTIKLAENIDLGASGSVKMGNTTVKNAGVTIANPADSTKNVSLSDNGLNNGGNKITNVAAGEDDKDAVNVGQLNEAIRNAGSIVNQDFGQRINQLNGRLDQVENTANAGVAQAIATAGLPQAYLPGKSMVAVGGGYYKGETGYAVGFSTISDGGNWIIKGTASGNSRGHFGASVGAGYQW